MIRDHRADEDRRRQERYSFQTKQDVCVKDGERCWVGGDEPHWRCGTSACGSSLRQAALALEAGR